MRFVVVMLVFPLLLRCSLRLIIFVSLSFVDCIVRVVIVAACVYFVARALSLFDAVLFRFNTACWLVRSYACSFIRSVCTYNNSFNCHCRYPAYLTLSMYASHLSSLSVVVIVVWWFASHTPAAVCIAVATLSLSPFLCLSVSLARPEAHNRVFAHIRNE